MDLTLSQDQEELLAFITGTLDGELRVARLHAREPVPEAAHVRTLGGLGWHALGAPEAMGGAGLGRPEEALLFRELGRRLGPVGCVGAVLGGRIAAQAGLDCAGAIFGGERGVAIAIPERPQGPVRLMATGEAALALLVTDEGASLLDLAGVDQEALPCLDRTIVMHRIAIGEAAPLARLDGPLVRDQALLLLAAMHLGTAEATRDMITDYAKLRHTFGRPIGAYQAVRHPIADMAARCAQAQAMLFYAALALDAGRSDASAQVAAARIVAEDAARANADTNIQLHGGIGVTDELSAHLYLKRTLALGTWLGTTKAQLRQLVHADIEGI